jgi:voltage-gated potassium channel
MTTTPRPARANNVFVRFRRDPSSLRYATAAIIFTTVVLVLVGAIVMRVFAHEQYRTFGDAIWFTLQTVTTVGYGDNTPTSGVGRTLASLVMLVSIGLISVVTALITSVFVRSIGRHAAEDDQLVLTDALSRIEHALAEAERRLERIEHAATRPDADAPD